MSLDEYYADMAEELKRKSDRVRMNFKTHKPSAGDNREAIVADFLTEHLPKAFGVGTGLILSKDDLFSRQADIVIVDQLYNMPLYSSLPENIWLAESVYVLIEVKTNLTPQSLKDSIDKCRRFKALPRDFDQFPNKPRNRDSLFAIWSFEAPSPNTVKDNYQAAINGIPIEEQPDFLIVPNSILIKGGSYHSLAVLGMPGSAHRRKLEKEYNGNINSLLGDGFEVLMMGNNALLAWIVWISSWLNGAGHRIAPLHLYLPLNKSYGIKI